MDQKFKALREDNDIFLMFVEAIFTPKKKDYSKVIKSVNREDLIKMRESGMTNKEIADRYGITIIMFYRLVKDLNLPRKR